jgi:hypothetical protein
MIISHKHRFIFIKTKKTAGTSIEIALSKYCGEDDVITPLTPEDDRKRREFGHKGPQNYYIPFCRYSRADWLRFFHKRKRVRFRNHTPASYIMTHIDGDLWCSYFKFCFERNPWDKVVSWYYWNNQKEPRPSISEFVQSGKANNIRGFENYTVDSNIVVDRVFLYEDLHQSMEEIAEKLGLPEVPVLSHAKGDTRADRRNYREILAPADIDKIGKVYAREIAYFGYR